ncbi:hypothetical protein [Actinoplanes sp. NPDC051494]|uniref:hypothetical protein n=1 Tax=Actinoplanes sp. NPDC051494 TaxID=3363907 RepID=UPI0037BCFE0F
MERHRRQSHLGGEVAHRQAGAAFRVGDPDRDVDDLAQGAGWIGPCRSLWPGASIIPYAMIVLAATTLTATAAARTTRHSIRGPALAR